jgi:hypothetical protein
MPLLDLKGYRKGKCGEKTVQEGASRHWSFFIDVSNAQYSTQIDNGHLYGLVDAELKIITSYMDILYSKLHILKIGFTQI